MELQTGILGGKRASDAPSLTDSRDYTFEESEDSIPHHVHHDAETKAKAIRGEFARLDDTSMYCSAIPVLITQVELILFYRA